MERCLRPTFQSAGNTGSCMCGATRLCRDSLCPGLLPPGPLDLPLGRTCDVPDSALSKPFQGRRCRRHRYWKCMMSALSSEKGLPLIQARFHPMEQTYLKLANIQSKYGIQSISAGPGLRLLVAQLPACAGRGPSSYLLLEASRC